MYIYIYIYIYICICIYIYIYMHVSFLLFSAGFPEVVALGGVHRGEVASVIY